QPRYNLLFRQIERDLLPLCEAEGLAVIPYNPLAGGFLSGKHKREGSPTAGTRFTLGTAAKRYQERYWREREFETVQALRALAAINHSGLGAVVAVLALYARSFGVSQSAIGLAIAIYGFARFAVAMPAGRLADRAGRRTGLALGGLVTGVGNLLCAFAPTYPVFIAGRFVAGAGAALVLI